MTAIPQIQIFECLHRSPHARLEQSAALGDGLVAALWNNRHDSQHYQAPSHHTLSCYVGGGTGTFRTDAPGRKGAPDKLCTLPAGQDSAWVVNGELRLAHLYFTEQQFALGCVTLLDREPREMHLRELTFLDDPHQVARFRQLIALDWQEPAERLLGSSLAHELLSHTLLNQAGLRGVRVNGGLAGHYRRRLVEHVDGALDQALTLGKLAALCNLSEYHFARMFRASFGLPPHQYVLARRMARACGLLRGSRLAVGEIALACGFASASHFTYRFKQAMGASPGTYRAAFLA